MSLVSLFRDPELVRAKEVLSIIGEVLYQYNLYSDKISWAGRYAFPLRLGGRPFLAGGFLKIPVDTRLLPKAVFQDQLTDKRLLTAMKSATGCNVECVVGDNLILPSLFGEKAKSGFRKPIMFGFGGGMDVRTFDLWYVVELDRGMLRGIPRSVPFSLLPPPDPSHILSVPLGHMVYEGIRLVDFPKDMISLLVCGATGQGKSSFLRSFIKYVCSHYSSDYARFMLADFKPARVDFKMFTFDPHCSMIVNPSDLIVAVEDENNRRAALLNSSDALDIFEYNKNNPPFPYLFVVIDEFASYKLMLNRQFGKKLAEDWFDRLMVLVSVTRSSGIYFVIGTQRPSVDVVPGQLKANIISRIAFSMVTETDANVVFDSLDLAEFPVQIGCRGRAFCLYGDQFLEFQSAFYM